MPTTGGRQVRSYQQWVVERLDLPCQHTLLCIHVPVRSLCRSVDANVLRHQACEQLRFRGLEVYERPQTSVHNTMHKPCPRAQMPWTHASVHRPTHTAAFGKRRYNFGTDCMPNSWMRFQKNPGGQRRSSSSNTSEAGVRHGPPKQGPAEPCTILGKKVWVTSFRYRCVATPVALAAVGWLVVGPSCLRCFSALTGGGNWPYIEGDLAGCCK